MNLNVKTKAQLLSQVQNMTHLHRHNSIEKSQDIQNLPKFQPASRTQGEGQSHRALASFVVIEYEIFPTISSLP